MFSSQKIQITSENCQRLTDLSLHQLIGLTGIYGYTSSPDFIEAYKYGFSDRLVYVQIKHRKLELFRVVELDSRIIYNKSFRNNTIQKIGIGTSILTSQINEARKAGFKMLKCCAFRYKNDGIDYYKGYIVWGKLGFVMEQHSQITFINSIYSIYPDVASLFDLLYHTPEGEQYWLEYGEEWDGYYDLQINAPSEYILYCYKSNKCIKSS